MMSDEFIILPLPDSEFQFTNLGIIIRGKPTFEQWQGAWQWLRQVDKASPWIAGDMLAYGEATYSEFTQELDIEDEPENGHYSYGSLRVYKHVSDRWPLLNRLTGIPWSYHYITASLPMAQRIELIEQVMNEPKQGRRKRLENRVRQLNNGKQQNPTSYPSDTTYEAEQRAYETEQKLQQAEQRIAELESQTLAFGPGPSKLPGPMETHINALSSYLQGRPWQAIVIYDRKDNRVEWIPR